MLSGMLEINLAQRFVTAVESIAESLTPKPDDGLWCPPEVGPADEIMWVTFSKRDRALIEAAAKAAGATSSSAWAAEVINLAAEAQDDR